MKIPLHDILERMLGIGKIKSKKELEEIIAILRLNPDRQIDFQKYAQKIAQKKK